MMIECLDERLLEKVIRLQEKKKEKERRWKKKEKDRKRTKVDGRKER